ncbi:MAG: WD40 repeat domain-containing protein [Hyphomonadaceae bacterium]|nr:WD40 repeat domain-containing protein [Hyphomonadaceae bacterium]
MTAQVYRNGRRLALEAGASSIQWIGSAAWFALGDGSVVRASPAEGDTRFGVHNGAILCAARHPDGARLVTGGDDGLIAALSVGGAVAPIAQYSKWIDHLTASAASGILVAGIGRDAVVFKGGAEVHRFSHPSSIGGIAMDQKGRRLAASHYGGVTLRYALMPDDRGVALKWTGSHLAVTLSPDSAYVISAMQENALHGWRLPEKTDLRMDGYPAKTKSLSWDKRGRWLATSGAPSAIVWPFVGKLGPQGKAPLQLAARDALVTCVAFHPSQDVVAIGYSDGAAVAVGLADEVRIDLDEPGEGPVTTLAWSPDGDYLAIADEAGRGALIQTT